MRGPPTDLSEAELRTALIADHPTVLSEALLAYDRMASLLAADHTGWVITHGEPKINNILITRNGPVMIDWDHGDVLLRRGFVEL